MADWTVRRQLNSEAARALCSSRAAITSSQLIFISNCWADWFRLCETAEKQKISKSANIHLVKTENVERNDAPCSVLVNLKCWKGYMHEVFYYSSGSLPTVSVQRCSDSSPNRKSTARLYLKSHHTGPQVLSHRLSLWWIRLLRPSQHCNRFSPETRLMSFTPPGSYSEQEHTAIIPFTSYNMIAYCLNPLRFLPHRFPWSVFLWCVQPRGKRRGEDVCPHNDSTCLLLS